MIECGFFDSVDRDRLYKAEAMTRPYELLVSNGVFATPQGTPSTYLQVYSNSGMKVTVKAGRGIFKDKWFINDSDLVLTLNAADVTRTRIDSIVARVDTSESVRAGSIIVKTGTPASSPKAPTMTRSTDVYEYRLADITVGPNVTSISQASIADRRGSADCGWVTSLIQQVDTSTLFEQFEDGFNTWFSTIKETLSTATLIRSYTSTYESVSAGETSIPIDISNYNYLTDILQVYINGLLLIPDVDYKSPSSNSAITLTTGVDAGTPVTFIVYKSVDGSGAETVIGQVEDLQADVKTLQTEISTTNTDLAALNQVVAVIKAGDGFTGEIDVPGAIRCHGVQVAYSNANNDNVQLGSSACDTLIHGQSNITLDAKLETLSLVPVTTSSYQIGNTSLRYNGIYLVNDPNVSSDERLKTNVEDVDAGEMLDFVNALEVVNYELIADPGVERIGLIAQQVEAVGGSKHVEVSEDGTYGLKPASLVYPLIAAVQRLTERNAELEKRIEALEQNE